MGDLDTFYDVKDEMTTELKVLPEGDFTAVIVKSKWKQTAKKTGRYLQFDFQIVSGEHKGSFVFLRLNLDNPSEVAVKIARATLSCIRHATGVMTPSDSSDLHNIPMLIHVVCQKRTDGKGMSNDITKYSAEDAMPGDNKSETKVDAPW